MIKVETIIKKLKLLYIILKKIFFSLNILNILIFFFQL